MNELGLFLRAAREYKAITIRQAEELSGISNAYLSQIETGKIQKPSPDILHKLSTLYQVPYEMLMEKTGHPTPDFVSIPDSVSDHYINLLIVDDSPEDRELIRIHLSNDPKHKYCSNEAETGKRALEILSAKVPDCVLLDYKLPDIDGLSLFEQIKKNIILRDTSIIILTGHGNEETAVKALKMGAVNYLNKNTMTQDKLVRAVLNAVQRNKIRESFISNFHEKRKEIDDLYNDINKIAADISSAFERIIKKNTGFKNDPDVVLISVKLNELLTINSRKAEEEASRISVQKRDRNEKN